jgi:membrane protease YdiL (CAAX protease family)
MDTPPTDPPYDVPPEPPIVLPASDLPPFDGPAAGQPVVLSTWGLPLPTASPPDTRRALFFSLLGGGAVVYVLLLIAGGLAQRFALDGLEVIPFLALALLAYGGERSVAGRIVAAIYWVMLMGTGAVFVGLLTALATIDMKILAEAMNGHRPLELGKLFLPHGLQQTGTTFCACVFAGAASAIGFAPWVRWSVARHIRGFDASSFVHATALSTVVGLTLILFAPLAVTGEPPVLSFVRHAGSVMVEDGGQDFAKHLSDPDAAFDQIFSFVWLVPLGIMAVGWPLYRKLPAALQRVGMVAPESWQPVFGLLLAVIMAFLMAGLVDPAIGRLWDRMHWPRTDESTFEQLMESLATPLGAVIIAVTAGIGEELFARGILQPRLGILLSNLFFTSLHALQYNWDGLLSVFLIGLVLGVVRKKTNTTTSAVVHGMYDFLLVMAQYYQFDPSKYFGF